METSPKPIVINQDQAPQEEKMEQKAAVKAIEIAFMKKKKAEEQAKKIQEEVDDIPPPAPVPATRQSVLRQER